MNIPSNHPRAKSLYIRELLVTGFRNGLVTPEGLIAHGRGEAFDYLLGEHTTEVAHDAAKAASSTLLLAKYPVISINGNVAALCAKEAPRRSDYGHYTGARCRISITARDRRAKSGSASGL